MLCTHTCARTHQSPQNPCVCGQDHTHARTHQSSQMPLRVSRICIRIHAMCTAHPAKNVSSPTEDAMIYPLNMASARESNALKSA